MDERPADAVNSAVPYTQYPRRHARKESTPFFLTPELGQRLDLLRHLTDNSEKILLVKGVAGVGKSTLLQQYLRQAREEWDLCCLEATHTLQPDQFFSLLYRRFGLTDNSGLNIDQLLKRFEMLFAAGRLPVVVIDDSQLLPVATLVAIFQLFERRPGNRALIRVVLFATPEITTQFQAPQLQAMNLQFVQSLDMPLFNPGQAQAFIRFLLDTGDDRTNLTLGSARIERLIRDAEGNPGQLERQLERVFSAPSSGVQKTGTTLPLSKVMAGMAFFSDIPGPFLLGGGLGVILLLTLLFQDDINRLFGVVEPESSTWHSAPSGGETLTPLRLPPLDMRREITDAPRVPQGNAPDVSAEDESIQWGMPELAQVAEEAVVLPVLVPEAVEPDPAASSQDSSGLLSGPETMSAPGGVLEKSAGESESVVMLGETQARPAPVPSQPIGPESDFPAETRNLAQTATSKSTMGPVTEVIQPQPSTVPAGEIRHEKWVLSQIPEHYTLQLVAVGDESAIQKFILQHHLKGDLAYFKSFRGGRPWYSLLYGVYVDRTAALKGRATLPPSLHKRDVWLRTFGSVQATIKE